jgi:hypothetical protein
MIQGMETTNTPETIRTSKSGFPIEECTRCYGTGHYSYNDVHGTMCYGCGGTGLQVIKRAKPAYNAYKDALRKMKNGTYQDISVGDVIAHNKVWREVTSVALTPLRSGGYSKSGNDITYHYTMFITVAETTKKDGTVLAEETFKTQNIVCVKRSGVVDPAPFVAMIPKPRQKRTK